MDHHFEQILESTRTGACKTAEVQRNLAGPIPSPLVSSSLSVTGHKALVSVAIGTAPPAKTEPLHTTTRRRQNLYSTGSLKKQRDPFTEPLRFRQRDATFASQMLPTARTHPETHPPLKTSRSPVRHKPPASPTVGFHMPHIEQSYAIIVKETPNIVPPSAKMHFG
jgi:hypothetical protein